MIIFSHISLQKHGSNLNSVCNWVSYITYISLKPLNLQLVFIFKTFKSRAFYCLNTSFVLTLAWNMQTTIAFSPPLEFALCPSSPRFQLRCLAHFFWRSFGSDVYYKFCRLCFNFHGPEGLEDARMSLLFHFLLFSYIIKPILPKFLARIRSWDEIIWSYLTFLWRLQAGNRPVASG